MAAAYDWEAELRALCGGMFNLDPFDWAGFDRFVLETYRMGERRPTSVDVREAVRALKPSWAATLSAAYENGIRLLETLAAMPPAAIASLLEEGRPAPTSEAARRAIEAAERLLRGER
jgi:hypothetical protein